MTIFDIKAEILACEMLPEGGAVNTETGEVIDTEQLKALNMDFDEKIKNISMWVKQLGYEAAALEDHEKATKARRRAVENKIESLKGLLVEALGVGGKRKFPEISCSIAKGRETAIFDGDKDAERALPLKYQNWRYEGLKKSVILEDLKAGIEIPGARIGTNPYPLIK